MTQKKEKNANRRTKIKDLPKQERELSKDEQKNVKGGDITARKGASKQETSLSSL